MVSVVRKDGYRNERENNVEGIVRKLLGKKSERRNTNEPKKKKKYILLKGIMYERKKKC